MTYEELLARTEGALLAVVRLHSPEGKPTSQCSNCKRFFPCHTIQAITKELND